MEKQRMLKANRSMHQESEREKERERKVNLCFIFLFLLSFSRRLTKITLTDGWTEYNVTSIACDFMYIIRRWASHLAHKVFRMLFPSIFSSFLLIYTHTQTFSCTLTVQTKARRSAIAILSICFQCQSLKISQLLQDKTIQTIAQAKCGDHEEAAFVCECRKSEEMHFSFAHSLAECG